MDPSGRTAFGIAASIERQLFANGNDAGRTLPTVRKLAADLGVSPATVSSAYKLLRARGIVSGRGRQGTRVAVRRHETLRIGPTALAAGLVDLSSGNPDAALLPGLERALRSVELPESMYDVQQDCDELVIFAAADFEADGIPADAVAVLGGGLDAIERILREHLRVGDRVAIEDPSFPGLIDLVSIAGYIAVPFALDDEGPLPAGVEAALASGCQAIIVTPRAQNPTGAALSASRAEELRSILRRFQHVLVIENDHSGPVSGVVARTLHDTSLERWAVVRSLSKLLGPDLRVAVVAGDRATVAKVCGRHALGARRVSHILQRLALALWSDPAVGRLIARAGEIYTLRRTATLAALEARRIVAHGQSGLNVWIGVRDEDRVVRALADRGWAVAGGERFRLRSGRGVRVTISTLVPELSARLAADLSEVGRSSQIGFA